MELKGSVGDQSRDEPSGQRQQCRPGDGVDLKSESGRFAQVFCPRLGTWLTGKVRQD